MAKTEDAMAVNVLRKGTVLVVDDNRHVLTTVKMLLEDYFEKVVCIAYPAEIPEKLRTERPQVVLLDMNFSAGINNGNEGLFWLGEIRRFSPGTSVVLFTAYADIDLAVRGLKEGAADFIVKPFDNEKMVATMTEVRDRMIGAQASGGDGRDTAGGGQGNPTRMIWGRSMAMRDVKAIADKVAGTDANVLITGENGTGKEVLANYIHANSARRNAPMIPIDLGAITETLFESELFGYMKGAFTDAKNDKPGLFEMAQGGTLFLDEIGNVSYSQQAKLLAAIQRRSILRVGGSKSIPIDVRLVCATNRDIQGMVRNGEFREDLLYRINTINLHIPPLREHREDIPDLAENSLKTYSCLYGKSVGSFTPAAIRALQSAPWPGNVRELDHAIERAVILCDGEVLDATDISLPEEVVDSGEPKTLDDMEKTAISKAIKEYGGNLSAVASHLGITRQTLYNKIKKYGI